jgi:tetratricopeptide (TPR) repeat protein
LAEKKTETEIANGPPAPTPEERVESWKEIAAYLQRDVRTVQRWEKSEALPVYRHMHDRLGTVYSYKAELDAWWNNRRPRLELEVEKAEAAEPVRAGWLGGRRLWVAAAAAVAVAAVAGGLWLTRRPSIPFQERDWVLITRFENRTGESLLDGTLEFALERELSNSRFVNVVPRVRVEDALRLMRKPTETAVDAALGREVSLRDGGIRALLTGRVEKLDSTYVLTASLVNPANGVTVASFSEQAEGHKQVLPAMARLSNRVRESLSEELAHILPGEMKLEKAATPSLRALQLYSQGRALVPVPDFRALDKWGAALEFFQQAVGEDPQFASAHLWLGWAYGRTGKREQGRPHFQRAFELADSTVGHEKYFILGSYYWQYAEDLQKAAQAFEAAAQLYPDHYWTIHILVQVYREQGRHQDARRYLIKVADLRPNDFVANYNAAYTLVIEESDDVHARPYLEKALELAKQPTHSQYAWDAAEMLFFSMYNTWQQGSIEAAYSELERLSKQADTLPPVLRDPFAYFLAEAYWMFGQPRAAVSACERIADQVRRHWCLCHLAFERDDREAFREHWRRASQPPEAWWVFQLAYFNLSAETHAELEKAKDRPFVRGLIETARAILLLHEGRKGAAARLEDAARQLRSTNTAYALYATELLAHFYEQDQDLSNAVRVLEEAEQEVSASRDLTYRATSAVLPVRARLALLYRKVGRAREAGDMERDLRHRLKYADFDHPLVRQLKQSQNVAAVQPAK